MRIGGKVLLVIVGVLFAIACNNINTSPVSTGEQKPVIENRSAPAPEEVVATMRPLYLDNCAECHGERGHGGVVTVKGKELRVPSLTGDHARKPTDEKLATKIREGDDDMPAFKDKFTAEQIDGLVLFIRRDLQGGDGKLRYNEPFTVYGSLTMHP